MRRLIAIIFIVLFQGVAMAGSGASWNPEWNRPSRIVATGDRELALTHIGDGKRALFQLKNMQRTDPHQKVLRKKCGDGSEIEVHTKISGMDVIKIKTPLPAGGWVEEEEIVTSIVPIIELRIPGTWTYGHVAGFVAFDLTEDGEWGEIIGTSTDVNALLNKDPVNPKDGRTTVRQGWCIIESTKTTSSADVYTESTIRVEQLPRIDSGNYAFDSTYANRSDMEEYYDVPPESGASTRCDAVVTPGPPDPSLCGYTWDMCCGFSYCGETGLFWADPLSSHCGIPAHIRHWWPEKFTQLIQYTEQTIQDMWMQVDSPTGDPDHAFTEVFRATTNFTHNKRLFGLIWGITAAVCENVSNDPPYLAPEPGPLWDVSGSLFNYGIGIYVFDHLEDYVLGMQLYDPIDYDYSGWYTSRRRKREAIIHFEDPGSLTSEQLEILDGNEGYVYDPPLSTVVAYDSSNCTSYNAGQWDDTGEQFGVMLSQATDVVDTPAGRFPIYEPPLLDTTYMYGGIRVTEQYHKRTVFEDMGIFSSTSTVSYDNPAYTYCHVSTDTAGEPFEARYGIVVDGKHYMSTPYAGSYYLYSRTEVPIPGVEVTNTDGVELKPALFIRAGLKTETIRRKYRVSQ